ncbi:hypothetical protein EIP91_004512 [Steccherinum ochraceum]|uniref:Telomere-associated protein Rif1 N-terminal domain-containing protein n=1 Tax=Steccherinum ochraceum TaxID=92696 RepID=A0A4R0R8Q5_9APHY|nr:hypothetical protein EIP91_004512 [Steccherinum ochraceum]
MALSTPVDIIPASASTPKFFHSPLTTLSKSLNELTSDAISTHDILQAYVTFCDRIKVLARHMSEDPLSCSAALEPVGRYASQITRCLQRDIRRALQNPFPASAVREDAIPESMAYSTPTHSDDDMKHAQDLSAVSQHALLLCSNIFRLPALSTYFEDDALVNIMFDVILVAKGPLPTPNDERTRSLALWILASQDLRFAVLYRTKRKMVSLLEHVISEEASTSMSEMNIRDGLKILHSLMAKHTKITVNTTVRYMGHLCFHLTSRNRAVRLVAAQTIGTYCAASLTSDTSQAYLWSLAGGLTRQFLSVHASSKSAEGATERRLFTITADILREDNADDLSWLLHTIGCLTIVSQGAVLNMSRFMRLWVNIERSTVHSSRYLVRALNLCLWRCFVLSMLLFRRYAEAHENDSDEATRIPNWKTKWFKGIGFLRQKVENGTGAAVLYSILSFPPVDPPPDSPTQLLYTAPWLSILEAMIEHSMLDVHRQGLTILAQLLSGVGTPSPASHVSEKDERLLRSVDPWKIIHKEFLTGTFSLASDFDPALFDVACIRCLTGKEVHEHWEDLMHLWEIGLDRTISSGKVPVLSDDVISIWHALLLFQSELTQQEGHLALSQNTTRRAISVLLRLFNQRDDTSSQPERLNEAQIRLCVAKQLWTVLKTAFAHEWLTDTAGRLLESIFRTKYFAIADDAVQAAWIDLCGDLVSVAGSLRIADLLSLKSSVLVELEIRQIWTALAKAWPHISEGYSWELCVAFLSIPVQHWTLSNDEVQLWTSLVPPILKTALADSISSNDGLVKIVQSAFVDSNSYCIALVPSLLSYITLDSTQPFPLSLFTYLNELMTTLYPQQESLYPMLDIFRAIRNLIQTYATSHLLQLLSVLSHGLEVWIRDEALAILDDEYSDIIIPLYCDCLQYLQAIPQTAQSLLSLESLLCSGFSRVLPPVLGPFACRDFWDVVSSRDSLRKTDCPERLRIHLLAFYDAGGGAEPPFGSELDSHEFHDDDDLMDVVPDSQPGSPVLILPDLPSSSHPHWRDLSGDRRPSPVRQNQSHSQTHSRYSSSERLLVERGNSPICFDVDSDDLPPSSVARSSSPPFMPPATDDMDIPSSPLVGEPRLRFPDKSYLTPVIKAHMLLKRSREQEEDDDDGRHSSTGTSSLPSSPTPASRYRIRKRAKTSSRNDGGGSSPVIRVSSPEAPLDPDDRPHPKKELTLSPEIPLPGQGEDGSQDDYALWEKPMTTPERRQVREALNLPAGDSEGEHDMFDAPDAPTSAKASLHTTDRSQSVPAGQPQQQMPGIRRAKTTPAPSSSVQMLQKAFRAVQGDQSDLRLDELLDAQQLLHETNAVLNKKLRKKYDSEGDL